MVGVDVVITPSRVNSVDEVPAQFVRIAVPKHVQEITDCRCFELKNYPPVVSQHSFDRTQMQINVFYPVDAVAVNRSKLVVIKRQEFAVIMFCEFVVETQAVGFFEKVRLPVTTDIDCSIWTAAIAGL